MSFFMSFYRFVRTLSARLNSLFFPFPPRTPFSARRIAPSSFPHHASGPIFVHETQPSPTHFTSLFSYSFAHKNWLSMRCVCRFTYTSLSQLRLSVLLICLTWSASRTTTTLPCTSHSLVFLTQSFLSSLSRRRVFLLFLLTGSGISIATSSFSSQILIWFKH